MDPQSQHDSFLRLLSQHSRRIFEFISTLVLSASDADEVFQNTCVVLWRKFENYDPEGSFYSWACKIAYYELLQLRRDNKKLSTFSDEVLALLADDALARSEHLNTRQSALESCLEKLNADDRQLIEQRYYYGKKPKEISAGRTGSVHSIYRALARIHMHLRECIERSLARELTP